MLPQTLSSSVHDSLPQTEEQVQVGRQRDTDVNSKERKHELETEKEAHVRRQQDHIHWQAPSEKVPSLNTLRVNSGCTDSLKHCSFAQPGLTFLSWDRLRSTLIVEIDKGLYV